MADENFKETRIIVAPVNLLENFQRKLNNSGKKINKNPVKKALSNEDVTNHTAALWKYFPVPQNEPEPFPEYHTFNLKTKNFKISAATVRGKKHKHEGTNCDDCFEVSNYDEIICVAVSDGAGSKKFSRIGAKESCKACVSHMKKAVGELFSENPDTAENISLPMDNPAFLETCSKLARIVQDSVTASIDAVQNAFEIRSKKSEFSEFLGRELSFSDFSSTLLANLIIPVGKKSEECLIITCQIGDGMTAVINNSQNSARLMGVPDSGEFSGETDFLTSPKMKDLRTLQLRTKISRCPMNSVLIMTDGVADDYFPNETEMVRLYFDLIINGIVNDFGQPFVWNTENLRLFKKLPDPVKYPFINDKSKFVSLQYTNRICSKLNISLEDICNNRKILSIAKLQAEEIRKIETSEERLKIWLDNYVERGSFDDRTLVVVEFQGGTL